jgi:hypothetical protein
MGQWKLYRTVWWWPSWVSFSITRYMRYVCFPY